MDGSGECQNIKKENTFKKINLKKFKNKDILVSILNECDRETLVYLQSIFVGFASRMLKK